MVKKKDHLTIWEWLLEMGPLKAFLLIETIGIIVGAIVLFGVHWYTKHYH